MAFERLEYGKVWTDPEDFPTHEDSEAQVRADLQYHPDAVRDFINGLIAALESEEGAASIGAAEGTLQEVLDAHVQRFEELTGEISQVAAGGVPVANQCVRVSFSEAEWTEDGSGGFVLRIPESVHRRLRDSYGYNLWERSGEEQGASWNTAATSVSRDEDTGDIVLRAPEAYAGAAAFFGL